MTWVRVRVELSKSTVGHSGGVGEWINEQGYLNSTKTALLAVEKWSAKILVISESFAHWISEGEEFRF